MLQRLLLMWLIAGMACEVSFGVLLIWLWHSMGLAGGIEIGLAVIIAYPLVWAHLLVLVIAVSSLLDVKQAGRGIICYLLERQATALRRRHQFFIVAVTGSVGKTSTKLAIAEVLAATKRVAYQAGNYNDRVTVPLVLFGIDKPASLYNLVAWAKVFIHNQQIIRRGFPYDGAVLELGTDHPGQIAEFQYLKPDISVVTSVSPEHMEYFGTLDAVAREELKVADFSGRLLINGDDVGAQYLVGLVNYKTYGLSNGYAYRVSRTQTKASDGQQIAIYVAGNEKIEAHISYIGVPGAKVVLAAFAVADMLGINVDQTVTAIQGLAPFAGRMQILAGRHGSTLIDDTYNASPAAVKAALDALYMLDAPKRIAILGSMNELGKSSELLHHEVGEYCDPTKLAVLATLGGEANKYLAPAARAKGCEVKEFTSPYEAGKWAESQLTKGAVLLAKGSQNGVFAEESLKALLANPEDANKLVRQSAYWMRRKHAQFMKSK